MIIATKINELSILGNTKRFKFKIVFTVSDLLFCLYARVLRCLNMHVNFPSSDFRASHELIGPSVSRG